MCLIATTVALAVFCSGVANAGEFMCKSENRSAQKDDRADKAKRVAEIDKEIIELQAKIGKLSTERAKLQPDLGKKAEEKKAEEKDEATKICEFLAESEFGEVPRPDKKAREDALDKLEKIRPDLYPHVVVLCVSFNARITCRCYFKARQIREERSSCDAVFLARLGPPW